MEQPSELEIYLRSHAGEGELSSQGEFTIAREQALRKIATFQLPFDGAWAVKLIQAIVAGGTTAPIRVDLGASAIHFHFQGPGFSLDELENAYYNPEPPSNRSLRHLLSALWTVGLEREWGFQVAFPQASVCLIWNGQQLKQVPTEVTRNCATISIAPLQQKKSLSWVVNLAASGRRNAELFHTLTRNCFPCPVPLTVDGRRVDLLQNAQYQGWSTSTFPLTIDHTQVAELPSFRIPPKTFDNPHFPFDPRRQDISGGGWLAFSQRQLKSLTAFDQATLAYILSVHMTYNSGSVVWESDTARSYVYWISDGVLVGEEPLVSSSTHCSIGCFLSAEGLSTDATTLNVLQTPEKQQRITLARKAMLQTLESFDTATLQGAIKQVKFRGRAMGVALVLGSIGMAPLLLFFAPIGVVVGVILIAKAGSDASARVETGRAGVLELREALRQEMMTKGPVSQVAGD